MKQTNRKLTDVERDLADLLKRPGNKEMFDEYGRQLELSYAMLQMRKRKKLSQAVVAKKLGTAQSNVARMEAGNQNFSLAMLEKIARVFGKKLVVEFR
ncbi:MAG: helix-turn-helix transcriptional regulator [Candidatus Magasanikbacteria bacterium]|nr:helix-turn-helix transcriptional regulator [Candidatus Magasanikbacteria bacterium]